jgi:hypothetical protein
MWRQLAAAWVLGSVAMGTIALIFTTNRDGWPFRPLVSLSLAALFLVLLLLGALGAGLLYTGWRTREASWLPSGQRGVALWAILVAVGGVAGFGYAAAVTFYTEFPLALQLVLGYVGGGLPFALVAAMLARPVRVNHVAIALTFVLLLTGFVLLDGSIAPLVLYLQVLFGPHVTAW